VGARFITLLAIALLLSTGVRAQQPPPRQQDEFVPISELPPQEQLPSPPLVITAYAFAWLAIGGYVLSVSRRLTAVQREIDRLETDTKRSR
jgi:CcmD family protein